VYYIFDKGLKPSVVREPRSCQLDSPIDFTHRHHCPLAVIDDGLELGIFAPRLGLAGEDDQVFLTRKKKKRKKK
jgi:hypothetical protein